MDHVGDVKIKAPSIGSIHVVSKSNEVFPNDLSGMTPNRDINFLIDLETGTRPILELKTRIRELFDKGFIRPSASLWCSPILFVNKKYGSIKICIDYLETSLEP